MEKTSIGQAAKASGASVKMIRHYETLGLLRKPARSFGNYRLYGPEEVHTLRFIKRARLLGFSMAEIKELVGLWRNKFRSSAAVKRIAGRHLEDLNRRIEELKSMAATLEHLIHHCHGDDRPSCPILEDLAKN
jgi:MerR family transcriptional regulator, copper efflux regulator